MPPVGDSARMVKWRCIPWYDEGEDWPEAYGPDQFIDAPTEDPEEARRLIAEKETREHPAHNWTGWNVYRDDDPDKPWEQL